MPAMVALPSHFKMFRPLVALLLVLWMAGLGCVIGCEMSIATATPEEEQAATETEDSCPMASRDCCRKSEDNSAKSVKTIPHNTSTPSCCPLTGQAADPARKVGSANAPLTTAGSWLLFASNSNYTSRLLFKKPLIANKGSTHLRCCVFRI